MIQGSGKSYTMMGSAEDETLKGIIPRLCDTLFARIDQVCSMATTNTFQVFKLKHFYLLLTPSFLGFMHELAMLLYSKSGLAWPTLTGRGGSGQISIPSLYKRNIYAFDQTLLFLRGSAMPDYSKSAFACMHVA